MDKEQAIELLEHLAWDRDIDRNLYGEALNMAIDALKAQLSMEDATKDAISRRAALSALNKLHKEDIEDYGCEIPEGFNQDNLDRATFAIKQLPTIQCEPQWIPVSERLPEKSEYYIITASDGVGHRTTFAKFQKKAKSWELTGARSYWKVIAWMPLPEPARLENV